VVGEAPALPTADPERKMLSFETLTYAPIDRRLIVAAMLSPGERDWLNTYHADVYAKIGPKVTKSARDWLQRATAPL
jgi:Xaa-Pro aminopeptidase